MFPLDSLFEDKLGVSETSGNVSGIVADEMFSMLFDVEDFCSGSVLI